MVIDNGSIVTVTDKAAEKARNILAERGIENGALRVFVVSGGCSGYQYGMAIARSREDDDIAIESGGITLLVDAESAPLLDGAEVDYVEDLMKSGFTIFNPNAVRSCACGSSFQTADGSGHAKSCC
ncbi:MAG TPA: iron-sulfur cluster assembly accessory protein [Dehalococcoidia bacterium]|jgi:iron-sulfur cluster assembly accessory protein|nr:iron-sulfur cluster assembly accessory protein [Dehalococcoidia bacterium]